jgi:hypothetical protein
MRNCLSNESVFLSSFFFFFINTAPITINITTTTTTVTTIAVVLSEDADGAEEGTAEGAVDGAFEGAGVVIVEGVGVVIVEGVGVVIVEGVGVVIVEGAGVVVIPPVLYTIFHSNVNLSIVQDGYKIYCLTVKGNLLAFRIRLNASFTSKLPALVPTSIFLITTPEESTILTPPSGSDLPEGPEVPNILTVISASFLVPNEGFVGKGIVPKTTPFALVFSIRVVLFKVKLCVAPI